MVASLRIAHVTDLHLRHHLPGTASIPTRLSRQMPHLFAQALNYLYTQAPDLLVISGDLTDYPLDQLDDATTQAQGEADLRLIADLLADCPCPIALVSGNHDHPALVRQVFSHLPVDQLCAGFRVLCFNDGEGPANVPRRIGSERERFVQAVADETSPPQIHVQHYVVWPEENLEYHHTYREGAWLRDKIVNSQRVCLVLSGHFHKGVPLFRLGQSWFATARAFCEAPHPFYLYEIWGKEARVSQFLTIDDGRVVTSGASHA